MPLTTPASRVMIATIAAVAFAVCFNGALASLFHAWSAQALYSYGFAVPLIAAYVCWSRWNTERTPRFEPDYVLGVPLTLAGVAMLVVGQIGALIAVQQVSMIVTLTGVLLLVFGRDLVRSHWFAIAYLLLMLPIWNAPISRLQDPSRLLSARIAFTLLDLSGVPVIRQGTDLILPSQTLSVLLECSGVNQLIALTAMVVPAAYLWLATGVRRIALLVFAVVVSYLANGFRIALVGWLAINGLGDGNINGPGHLLQGLIVSTVAYLAIGAFLSLLSKSMPRTGNPADDQPVASPAVASTAAGRRVWLDIAMLAVMLVAGAARLSASQRDVELSEQLQLLESRIGDWVMEVDPPRMAVPLPSIDDDLVDVGGYRTLAGERRFVAVDDELVRVYRNSAGDRVRLYIGYYNRQEDGKELTGDAGADLADAASALTVPTPTGPLELNEIVRTNAGTRRGVVFWYDINGRIVSDFYRLKSYTIWDAVTRQRTNGAVVIVAWDDAAGARSDNARDQAIGFAQALLPVLRRHLPV